jgi:hypothetical protein
MTKARLLACPGCARHLRVTEVTCVFCGLVLAESFRNAVVVPPPPRMSRSGLYAYRARAMAASTAALVTASCGGTGAGPSDAASDAYGGEASMSGDSAPGDESVATLYGLPVFDASTGEDSASSDASRDASPEAGLLDASAPDVGVVAMYGAPPVDASVDARMIAPPYGSPAPAYGAPGFFDDDGGTSRD